jgi:hypothetical protein
MEENKSLYEFLTNQKVVKISTIIAFTLAVSLLFIGYYIAAAYGTTGYNLFDNYISDQGSIKYTPFPYMRTIANVSSGPFFIPFCLYLRKEFLIQTSDEKVRQINIGFVGILGFFLGMICTGIITEDVNLRIHSLIAVLNIGLGFIGCTTYGLLIVKNDTEVPKGVGYFLILFSPLIAILAIIGFPTRIFYEWIFLFSIWGGLIACSIFLLKKE